MEVGRGQTVSVNIAGVQPFFGSDQIPNVSEELRRDPKMRNAPTIGGDLRSPASIEAMNLGVDADSDPERMAQLEAKAGVNLFSAIKGFSQSLKDGNRVGVNTAIDDMEKGFKQVLASRSTVGARQNIVNLSNESLEITRANAAGQISSTEDADVLQVYSDLGKNENVLKASLEMNRKLLTPSLLDFLK
jgi:flagellin-like hook-associated protein FlgL